MATSEQEHVRRLVERAEMEPDPQAFAHQFLETAWRLKQTGKGIFKDRPWMPRTFCGPKAITWVIEAMEEDHQDPELAEVLQQAADRMSEKMRRRYG